MAFLWTRGPEGWTAAILDASRGASVDERGVFARDRAADAGVVLVARRGEDGDEAWLLLCAAFEAVSVNGDVARAGAVVLRDRDEVRVAGGRPLFFAARHGAVVEACAGSLTDRDFRCARCRRPFEAGAPIVRCPACGVVHHESERLPCWTYVDAGRCAACREPGPLDEAPPWTPEEL